MVQSLKHDAGSMIFRRLSILHPPVRLSRLLGLVLLAVLSAGCSTLPTDLSVTPSTAFTAGPETKLGSLFEEQVAANPGRSGLEILDTGRDGLRLRLAAVMLAERAIDLQYYIWNGDHSGRLLADRVLQAADRGVRVRLLLDDYGVGAKDGPLSAMDAHPNVEVRLYNPNANRGGVAKWLAWVGEFGRLNQRMHNKSFVVDGSVAVIGGRNIGDEYFDLDDELNFRDRDLLAVGPVVDQVASGFDAYWNSGRSFPISSISAQDAAGDTLRQRRSALAERLRERPALAYEMPETVVAAESMIRSWRDKLVWAEAVLLIDQVPALEDTDSDDPKQVAQALSSIARQTRDEMLIESAYLVLGDPGLELVRELRSRDVRVRALTNSLASNDVTGNHAAYARRRPAMLEDGIELYEFRPDAASCRDLIAAEAACADQRMFGLHAKSVVFDRETVFVGSFNLNQRSVYLNSELGLLVHSPQLAERIARDIEQNMRSENSWRVALDEQGRVRWIRASDGRESQYVHEPETGFWRRFRAGLIAIFPIEKYL